ncbi:histidine kinase [candidate division LCP-89 bacterium B3_LCP]|uniref:Histidine kinase n=1 Tax=candidate division LCP-89 bacterium B3_LCP TaxID=2012998 RepID=A0A532V501_UNCL8|nr:MAG: histidine kinase [candidate division LCP-89 bacterium B3_LCP]
MDENQRYERARKRVEEIKGFYTHLLVYVLVNIFLVLFNWFSSPGHWWFQWPLIGWGIGLAVHWLSIFGLGSFLGKEWEERKIKEIVEKDKGE